MKIPTLDRWEAGDQPNDVMFNKMMDIIEFVSSPPEGHFTTGTATQIIPGITWTPVNWTTVVRDREAEYDATQPMWSATNPSRIYIRTRGWYELELASAWAGPLAFPSQRRQSFRIDGAASTLYRARFDRMTDPNPVVRNVYDIYLDSTSYIEMMVFAYQGGSTTLADYGANGGRTSLRLKWYSL